MIRYPVCISVSTPIALRSYQQHLVRCGCNTILFHYPKDNTQQSHNRLSIAIMNHMGDYLLYTLFVLSIVNRNRMALNANHPCIATALLSVVPVTSRPIKPGYVTHQNGTKGASRHNSICMSMWLQRAVRLYLSMQVGN